jgi:hypothetical protein
MRHLLKTFALASAVVVAACAKPVPPEQKDFIGLWEAPEMRLLITADGSLDYKRIKGGGSTSINAPIQEFTANGFSAGLGPLKTDFKVSQRPHAVDGVWRMTVDGVELTRQEGGGFVGESN